MKNMKKLLALRNGLAVLYLHGTEIRLAESIKIDLLFEEILYLHLREVDLAVRREETGLALLCGLILF